jgi:uncharacterized oxidoreductase
MPLTEYIAETMHILQNKPAATEILVERAKLMRFAERSGGFDALFQQFNPARAAQTP